MSTSEVAKDFVVSKIKTSDYICQAKTPTNETCREI